MKRIVLILLLLLITVKVLPQGDCPNTCVTVGGSYLATAGSTPELNAANRGCLTAGEANSSYWFQVCFTTNGVYQFFIDPNGNRNDFDFAVWDGAACPPTTAPIRCSWAAVPPGPPCATCDYTGLGNGALDLSEGAAGNGWVAPINVVAGQCLTININNYGSGSSNFTMDLTGTTATMSCLPLPIELTDFHCETKSNNISVFWTTATETNNDYFELWRSSDAINFIKILTKDGAGTSTSPISYWHQDYLPPTGTYYYRLKQVDFDGVETISEITSCNYVQDVGVVITYFNAIGQEVNILTAVPGFYIKQYSKDGNLRREVYYKTEK